MHCKLTTRFCWKHHMAFDGVDPLHPAKVGDRKRSPGAPN